MLRNRKEIAKNIVEIWVWDSKLATGSKRGNGPGSVWYLSLNTLYPSLCSSSSGYLQRLTQVYSRQGAIWSGWLNLRVALSRHRLAHLLNIVFFTHHSCILSITFALQCWKVKFGYGELLDTGWGMKMLGGPFGSGQSKIWSFGTHC